MLMKPEVYAGVKKPEWASRGSDLPAVPHLKAAALSSEWARDTPPQQSVLWHRGKAQGSGSGAVTSQEDKVGKTSVFKRGKTALGHRSKVRR